MLISNNQSQSLNHPKVWYQNSRARERKGQFRQNLQIIHKQCPYCAAIFKVKSALESHLLAKHPDRPAVPVDRIADYRLAETATASTAKSTPTTSSWPTQWPLLPLLPQQQLHGVSPASSSTLSSLRPDDDDELLEDDHDQPIDFSDDDGDVDDIDGDDLDDANDCEERPSEGAAMAMENHNGRPASKRVRTPIGSAQMRVLRQLFAAVRRPSMANCQMAGTQLGLAKRVVQVSGVGVV